jgi:hypothetical protein
MTTQYSDKCAIWMEVHLTLLCIIKHKIISGYQYPVAAYLSEGTGIQFIIAFSSVKINIILVTEQEMSTPSIFNKINLSHRRKICAIRVVVKFIWWASYVD